MPLLPPTQPKAKTKTKVLHYFTEASNQASNQASDQASDLCVDIDNKKTEIKKKNENRQILPSPKATRYKEVVKMTKKEAVKRMADQLFQLKMENLYLWKKKEQYGGLLWSLKQAMEDGDIELIKTLLNSWVG